MNKNQNESVQQAADRPKTLRIVLSIVIAFFVWMAAMLAAPEITKAIEAADAEPNADNPVPMPTADPEQFKTYQVPDEFMRVYKTLSTATEMMKNTWKRVLKNNQSYLSDPEKQKVLRFAMQRPALYLNELEACMEQILAETLEEAEKTA